jgi:hypothetical protein
MKKILLAALAAFTLFGTAHADSGPAVGLRFKWDPVLFRSQAASNPNAVVDSAITSRVGAAGASSVLDTTAAIGTDGWGMPTSSNVLADSNEFARLVVYDAPVGDCQSGADSLAVATQVSADGVSWVTLPVVAGQSSGAAGATIITRNNQTILNGVFMDVISQNGASIANGPPVWIYRFKFRGAKPLGSTDIGDLPLYPMVRFILSFHDAAGYIVSAKLGHLSNTQ